MAEYLKCLAHTWDDDTPAPEARFVVFDAETTELDRTRNRLITIGAVAMVGDEILLEDSFADRVQRLGRDGAWHHPR